MKLYSDNSFFHQNYDNLKVLVFVPHQDDEINTVGTLLYSLAQCKAQITLVYATNGDWEHTAEVRFKEAVNAAGILGVTEDNIYFMGYGDTLNSNDKSHIFYHKNTVARSPAGHTETYGTDTHPDFAFLHEKQHHSYTSENYLNDLLSIIRKTEADIIIATDFDHHADHRMLSLYFDKAIGIIRKENPSYKPEINRFHPFKGWFAQPYKGPTLASASMTLAFTLFKPSWYDYLPPLKGSSYSFLNNESSI